MTKKNTWLDDIKSTISTAVKRDFSKIPQNNVTARIISMDTEDAQYGWLLEVEIVSADRAVGETIKVTLGAKGQEWANTGKLDSKLNEGSIVYLQRLQAPERGSDVYKADRLLSVIVDPETNDKKARKTYWRVPVQFVMRRGEKFQLLMGLPDTKQELTGGQDLIARVTKDVSEGRMTLLIGTVGGKPISILSKLGEIDQKAEGAVKPFVFYDAERVAADMAQKLKALSSDIIEKAEGDLEIELNAYTIHALWLGQSARDQMVENMATSGRSSLIQIDTMFPRSLARHLQVAQKALQEDFGKVEKELKAWIAAQADDEEKAAFARDGYRGLKATTISGFLTSLGVDLPQYSAFQATSYQEALARFEQDKDTFLLATGWVWADVVTERKFDRKAKAFMHEYPVRVLTHSTTDNATPFFPDSAVADLNIAFLKAVREGLAAWAKGERKQPGAAPQAMAESHDGTDDLADGDSVADEIDDLLGGASFEGEGADAQEDEEAMAGAV